jgi:Ca2+-binding EF-hand superfamily protein
MRARVHHIPSSQASISQSFEQTDVDSSGFIDFSEFAATTVVKREGKDQAPPKVAGVDLPLFP